jgi:tRNA threonylcarbamoyladenosine biosynthesis protein TsaB
MLTLSIDTSTNILSVVLVRDDEVLASLDEQTKNNQSEILMSRIETMAAECCLLPTDLERIAVAVGPGSYTGIRVGVAAAKSLGYTLNIPVIGISSLEIMANAVDRTGIVVSMIDARRGTVFAGAYDSNGEHVIPDGHYTIDGLLSQLDFENDNVSFVGDGAAVHRDQLLAIDNAHVVAESDFNRSKAEVLAELARLGSQQESIHLLVPNYLRKTEAEMNAGV